MDVDLSDVGSYLYNAVTFQQLDFSNASLSKSSFSLALVLKSLEVLHICCIREGTFILEEEGVERRHLEKISFLIAWLRYLSPGGLLLMILTV